MDTVDLTIRIAGINDADALADVGAASFRAAYGPHASVEDTETYLEECFTPAAVRTEMAKGGVTYLLATANGLPAGLAKLRDGDAPDEVPGTNVKEVHQLYI